MSVALGEPCWPWEEEYIPPATNYIDIDISNDNRIECEAQCDHYTCSRMTGHDGPHVAHGIGDQMLAVWEDKED